MAEDPETVFAANRRYWDRSTPQKMDHGSYPLAAFQAGESTLFDHERDEVGEVSGRSLLHLQCNNGLETLSWAREGADAVGVDISGESLRVARELAAESGLDARFVQCNVYDVADALDRRFDVVYTSRGVLGWLPNLDGWADAIARSLADDGTFYLFEGHPLVHSFDGDLEPARSYFETGPRERTESDFGADERHFLTHHRLGEVVTALASAGLTVEFLREHPFDYWRRWDRMVRDDAGRWRLPDDPIPLTFSLRARPT
ncbi:class I SAM-dependent methyltransferase [Halosimplex litoreum]|uniref:Class I SAM-dependent methyltransferase n=1 Tax=Halosimplex litoreum TaxID=1198301 RepID=A0A7T3FYH1_9EURY|nr:class I SAM-dependent methyltransferase [Halosimplex litoreum]QPV63048.1 class I SAM-dependent methyltransferase [Halosimplex litoreum]